MQFKNEKLQIMKNIECKIKKNHYETFLLCVQVADKWREIKQLAEVAK